jgi:hypothetical protein
LAACFIFPTTAATPLAAVLPTLRSFPLHWLIEFPRIAVLFHVLDSALSDRVLLPEITVVSLILRVTRFENRRILLQFEQLQLSQVVLRRSNKLHLFHHVGSDGLGN